MKKVRIFSVFAILLIFPLGSYLYIRQGYYFRLDALKQLQPKEKIEELDFPLFLSEDTLRSDVLKGRTTLLYSNTVSSSLGMIQPVFEEFSHRADFQIFSFGTNNDTNTTHLEKSKDYGQWNVINADYQWDKAITLVDSSGAIRNYYEFDSSSFLSLGQHIAIVLPREKEKDIVMKGQKAHK